MELFISDLDGTLFNSAAEVSDVTEKKLNALIENGLAFSIATARSLISTTMIMNGVKLRLPMILMNGVLIYDPVKGEYEVINRLSDSLCRELLARMREHGLDCLMYTLTDGEMTTVFERLSNRAMQTFYDERKAKYGRALREVGCLEDMIGDNIYFTLLDTYERLKPLYEELKDRKDISMTLYNDIYDNDFWYLEIFSVKATKENGVRYLRQKLSPEKVTVFGDNLNDLSLFAGADEKIAVSNAKQELIDRADKVIGANDDDGVVRYLEEVFYG